MTTLDPGAGRSARRPRRGLTLTELLVTMVIVGIIGAAFTRLMIHQSRFMDSQSTAREARSVSRGALNMMLSELRRVTRPRGVLVASRDSVVIRVPYAFGVLCSSTASASTISLAPMDSLTYAEGGTHGYAWRDSTGNYAYVNTSFSLGTGLDATCLTAGITTLAGGKVVTVAPVVPAAAVPGTPVLLYRRIQYEFAESVILPGRQALWRINLDANTSEEIVAPFTGSSRFRFFEGVNTTAQATVPAVLDSIRGLEVRLMGASDRLRFSDGEPSTSDMRTAVFFMNRMP